jgi:hypothetical protein
MTDLGDFSEHDSADGSAGEPADAEGGMGAAEEVRDGVLYLNPGSAGPRRFRLPVTVARLHCRRDAPPRPHFIDLDAAS